MVLKSFFIVWIFSAFAVAGERQGQIFSHEWGYVAKTAPSCQEQATQFGQRFEKVTALSVVRVFGVEEQGTCRLRLSFAASEPVPFVSTNHYEFEVLESVGSFEWSYDVWHFKTLADCQAELPEQISHFREQTGLEPIISDCYRYWMPTLSSYINVLRIQSFGVAKNMPQMFEVPASYDNGREFTRSIERALVGEGTLFHVSYANPAIENPPVDYIHYYAADAKPKLQAFHPMHTELRFAKSEECNRQLTDVLSWVSTVGVNSVASECSVSPNQKKILLNLVYRLADAAPSLRWLDPSNDIGTYDSFETCWNDRARMQKIYHDKLGIDIKGAMCSQTDEGKTTLLFVRN